METVTPLQQVPETHDREIIPAHPTEQIVLQIEEIPSLDVFYSPNHKVVVKRIKRRGMDDTVSKLTNESVDVLWKDPLADHTENLTKLAQLVGEYATATIENATEVQLLLKQREDKVQ